MVLRGFEGPGGEDFYQDTIGRRLTEVTNSPWLSAGPHCSSQNSVMLGDLRHGLYQTGQLSCQDLNASFSINGVKVNSTKQQDFN